MNKLKHVIFTSSDAKYGDFLIDHWLKSLQDNVDLSNIDVVVLDYGLSRRQVNELKSRKVIVKKCVKDGHVTSLRFRDIGKFLSAHSYDQVLSADGGDIIFQSDISHLFEDNKDDFRAHCEDFPTFMGDFFKICFRLQDQKKITDMIKDKKVINAGFLLGPSKKFICLCDECNDMIILKNMYGPDQVAVNYFLYRDGFKRLDSSYNFLINNAKESFYVDKGEFYYMNDEKIPVIHNAGSVDVCRSVKNFGYGQECNEIKKFTYFSMRGVFKFFESLKAKFKADV